MKLTKNHYWMGAALLGLYLWNKRAVAAQQTDTTRPPESDRVPTPWVGEPLSALIGPTQSGWGG